MFKWYIDGDKLMVVLGCGDNKNISITLEPSWAYIGTILKSDRSEFEKEILIRQYVVENHMLDFTHSITSNKIIWDISKILKDNTSGIRGEEPLLIESLIQSNSMKISVITVKVIDGILNTSWYTKQNRDDKCSVISEVNLSMKIASAVLTMVQTDMKKRVVQVEETNVLYALNVGMYIVRCLIIGGYVTTYNDMNGLTQVEIGDKFINDNENTISYSNMPSLVKYCSYCREKEFYIEDELSMIQPFENNKLMSDSMVISDEKVDVLNKLQDVEFNINKKFLGQVLSDYDTYLKRFKKGETIYENYPSHNDYIKSVMGSQYRKTSKAYETASNGWYNSRAKTITFKNIIICSVMYSDMDMYFRCVIDHRGRVYYLGYPINPQLGEFVRKLINVSYHEVEGYDATASGLQIIGCMTGDEKILMDTFLIEGSDVDIYQRVYNEFIKIDDPVIKKYEKYINRKLIKYTVMPMIYSETPWGRNNSLRERIDVYIKNEESIIIGDLIVDTFNKLYPSFGKFIDAIKHVNRSCKNKWYTICSTEDYHMFYNIYVKQESHTVRVKINGETYKRNLRINKFDGATNSVVADKKKCDISFMANFIQHIDSNIITLASGKLFDRGIKHYIVHDCIYVPSECSDIANECYLEAVVSIFDKDVFAFYVKMNGDSETINEVLNENWLMIKKNHLFRKDILQLDKNEYDGR